MEAIESAQTEVAEWFVLRDLKRPNSKSPAYKVLADLGIEVFTPMRWILRETRQGVRQRIFFPYIPSLLFARGVRSAIDSVVFRIPTLQYRYVKGAPKDTPMVVPTDDMDRFIRAVSGSETCNYYSPEELSPEMIGREVVIKGGPLDGSTGRLLKIRGSRKKRLIVELRGLIAAAVEVSPEYIQIV